MLHALLAQDVAFLHVPTKTLIEADLMFALPPTEQVSRLAFAEIPLRGADRSLGPSQYSKSTKRSHIPYLSNQLTATSASRCRSSPAL